MPSHSLYRAWRPQRFADMVGQEHVARTLLNSLREGRTAHAYLFTGPRGTGKTSAARILAKAMNCAQPQDGEPCNACPVCVAITEGRALDVLEIDGASNRGIDQIRDLREKVNLAPSEGRYRFYIIDEVHQLTSDAFNALLKTLEEPPQHVVFVLATTDPLKVPATVSSRCQRFAFHRIAEPALVGRLQAVAKAEGIDADEEALRTLARAANGGLRDGLSLLDQAIAYCGTTVDVQGVSSMLGLVPAEAVGRFADALERRDATAALDVLERLLDEGNDPRQFCRQVVEHLHERLLARADRRQPASPARLSPPELVRLLRVFSDVQFGGRLVHAQQMPLELAVVAWCADTPSQVAASEPLPQAGDIADPSVASSNGHATAGVRATPSGYPAAPASAGDGAPAARPRPEGEADGILAAPAATVPPPAASDYAASPLTSAGVPEDVRRSWLRTVHALKARSPKLNAYCNSCQLQGLDGDTLVLTTQVALVREQLQLVTVRRQIEDVATTVFGRPVTIRCGAAEYPGVAPRGPAAAPQRSRAGATAVPSPSAGTPTAKPPVPTTSGYAPVAEVRETEEDPLAQAIQDPVVQEVLKVFGGGRVDGVIPHQT